MGFPNVEQYEVVLASKNGQKKRLDFQAVRYLGNGGRVNRVGLDLAGLKD